MRRVFCFLHGFRVVDLGKFQRDTAPQAQRRVFFNNACTGAD